MSIVFHFPQIFSWKSEIWTSISYKFQKMKDDVYGLQKKNIPHLKLLPKLIWSTRVHIKRDIYEWPWTWCPIVMHEDRAYPHPKPTPLPFRSKLQNRKRVEKSQFHFWVTLRRVCFVEYLIDSIKFSTVSSLSSISYKLKFNLFWRNNV